MEDERLRLRKRGLSLALISCAIAAWTLVFELECVFRIFGLLAWLAPLFRGRNVLLLWGSQLLLPIVGMILARLAVNYPGRLPKLMALFSMITCLSVEIDYVSRLLGGLKIG
jgi:hypothetical protein